MHHTDYSSNLRNTQHKTLKNLSPNRSEHADAAGSKPELLRAGLAVLLVIIVLLQMDPANAEQVIKPDLNASVCPF